MRTSRSISIGLRAMSGTSGWAARSSRATTRAFLPGTNVMRITYDAATDPDLAPLFTTTCRRPGRGSAASATYAGSAEDLLAKQKMIRVGRACPDSASSAAWAPIP